MVDDTRRTVSVSEACEQAGVCRRTLYWWMQKGWVEFKYTAGGSRRIYVDTLFYKTKPRTKMNHDESAHV